MDSRFARLAGRPQVYYRRRRVLSRLEECDAKRLGVLQFTLDHSYVDFNRRLKRRMPETECFIVNCLNAPAWADRAGRAACWRREAPIPVMTEDYRAL